MMENYFPAVNFPNTPAIDPYKIARGEQHVDPQLFQMYLTASMTNLDALLYEDGQNKSENDMFNSTSLFPSNPYSSSGIPSSPSVYEEMITRSNLIGKTVVAIDPQSRQTFSGKVTGVAVESGNVQIIVGGKNIPPENLLSVKE